MTDLICMFAFNINTKQEIISLNNNNVIHGKIFK